MDFDKMLSKLDQSEYSNAQSFLDDIDLIAENALVRNSLVYFFGVFVILGTSRCHLQINTVGIIQARIAQLVSYRLGTGEVPGSNPSKGENFSIKISNSSQKDRCRRST